MSNNVKSEISKNEAVQQREILKELYQKDLINKYSKTNGYDKVYMFEQINELFGKYKVNKENMERVEKKMLKQFDQNYMKHFQMKQANMVKEKSQKKLAQNNSQKNIENKKQQAQTKDKEESKVPSQAVPSVQEKKQAKTSIIKKEANNQDDVSLAHSKPCDLNKLWEIENAKLREKKLKDQEERRRELEAQQLQKKQADMLNQKQQKKLTKNNQAKDKEESKVPSQAVPSTQEKKTASASNIKSEVNSLAEVSLANSKPCDLKKLWEIENAKLRKQKLKDQEERRRDLDANRCDKKIIEEKEKQEDVKYMQQVRKENRRLDRIDREKARLYKIEVEKEIEKIEIQKEEKKKIFQEEKDYDMKKHNEMMSIVNKQNKIEEEKDKVRAREARKLLRNQVRDMKKFFKREKDERDNEKVEEQGRMQVYAEMEEKRFQQREKDVKDREDKVKKVMNTYHEKIGKDLEEYEKEDEEKMFKEMMYQDKKDNEVEEYRKGVIQENKKMLKRTLFKQMDEKKLREIQERNREIQKDNYFNDINQKEMQKALQTSNNDKQNKQVYNSLLKTQMMQRKEPILNKMNSQELLINKDKLKYIEGLKSNPISPVASFPLIRKMIIKDF